jgi:hypothetical protein
MIGSMRADSRLERVLRSGRFAVTAELAPADTSDPKAITQSAWYSRKSRTPST